MLRTVLLVTIAGTGLLTVNECFAFKQSGRICKIRPAIFCFQTKRADLQNPPSAVLKKRRA
jgi:hypothetical protein